MGMIEPAPASSLSGNRLRMARAALPATLAMPDCYRRVLELQARLLARVVTGELPRYPGFETR